MKNECEKSVRTRKTGGFCGVITPHSLYIQTFIWLGLPMLLFLYGWMKWWISVPLSVMILYCAFMQLRSWRKHGAVPESALYGPDANMKWRDVRVSGSLIASIVAIACVLVFCGMGGFVAQHSDYYSRNAVFFDLARKDWPVVYDGYEPRILCYYFAFWLPSAVVSKVTGFILPGDIAQLLWGFWGMSIGFCWLASYLGGRVRWYYLPLLLLFGFWDAVLYGEFHQFLSELFGVDRDEFYSNYMTFSLMSQLRMIFNQTISLWVALPVLYINRRRPGALLLISSFLFLYSPLPCVGISLAVLYWLLRGRRQSFTVANLTGLLTMAVVGLFYMSNNSASGVDGNPRAPWYIIILLGIMFFVVAVGVILPFVWDRIGRDRTFYIMVATVFFLPLLALGENDDLCRRAMIPMTIMLTYAVMGEIRCWKLLPRWKQFLLPVVIVIGFFDAGSAVADTVQRIEIFREKGYDPKLTDVMGRLDNRGYHPYYDNFIADGDGFYTRYLMKKE